MADIAPTITNKSASKQSLPYVLVTWSALTNADTGAATDEINPSASDKTLQMDGTFNGATFTLEGSLDGVNFFTLVDQNNDVVSLTGGGIRLIGPNCLFYRIAQTVAGGGSTSVNAKLMSVGS